MTHLQKYGRAYLVGFVFFVVTNAEAVDAVFGKLTPAELNGIGKRQLAIMMIQVLALAGTNILAYLNQTLAKSDNKAAANP